MVACHAPPTGDLACNPGMCPDRELNWQPFGSQASAQSTEPHQPGLENRISNTSFISQVVLGSGEFLKVKIKQKRHIHVVMSTEAE